MPVNPTKFNNLEEYGICRMAKITGFKRSSIILQHSYDAQNKSKYDLRPSPFNLQGDEYAPLINYKRS